jgi:hypothetical protein
LSQDSGGRRHTTRWTTGSTSVAPLPPVAPRIS